MKRTDYRNHGGTLKPRTWIMELGTLDLELGTRNTVKGLRTQIPATDTCIDGAQSTTHIYPSQQFSCIFYIVK